MISISVTQLHTRIKPLAKHFNEISHTIELPVSSHSHRQRNNRKIKFQLSFNPGVLAKLRYNSPSFRNLRNSLNFKTFSKSDLEGEFDWEGIGSPMPGWQLIEPKEFYFAIANASSLMLDGALLEEVLKDGKDRALREGRDPDVWLIMEPAFLNHPGLSTLKKKLTSPTAAIVSTNGQWMTTIVKELLPQAMLGKFKAPTKHVPNPFKCNLDPKDTVIGGGGVWH